MKFDPVFRLEIKAPRSEDPTEATTLTPIAGAPHTDPFKVADREGVTGYLPYLAGPRGRTGKIDPLTKQVDMGMLNIRIQDRPLVVGAHAERWATAFIGDAHGKPRLGGCLVLLDLSLTGPTGTFTRYWTGRVVDKGLRGRGWFEFSVRDLSTDYAVTQFPGTPHSSITYTTRGSLLPLGFCGSPRYGSFPRVARLVGTVVASPFLTLLGTWVQLTNTSVGRADNLLTKELARRLDQLDASNHFISTPDVLRCRLRRTDTQADGVFQVLGISRSTTYNPGIPVAGLGGDLIPGFLDDQQRFHPRNLLLLPLPTTHAEYMAMPPQGTTVQVFVYPEGRPTPGAPIYVTDVAPGQLVEDAMAGKLSWLDSDGAPIWSFPTDTTSVNAIKNDPSIPLARLRIDEPIKTHELLAALGRAHEFAGPLDAEGKLTLVDMRLPGSLSGLPSITEADLVAGRDPEWDVKRASAVTRLDATYYIDRPAPLELVSGTPDYPAGGVDSVAAELIFVDFGDPDLAENRQELDAISFRTSPAEQAENGMLRQAKIEADLQALVERLRGPFGRGAIPVVLYCRRTTAPLAVAPGGWFLADAAIVPNLQTLQRGGSRLLRAVEVVPDAGIIRIGAIDSGLSIISTAPVLGNIVKNGSNPLHGVTIPVTVNAEGQAVEVQIVTTPTSVGVRPAADDPGWTHVARVTATGDVVHNRLPSGLRVWARARSESTWSDELKLPSAWVFPPNDKVDLDALTAPSAAAASLIEAESALITWTPGETDEATEFSLSTPASGDAVFLLRLPAGSARHRLLGLTASTEFKVWLRHVDAWGGVSAFATVTFNTTAIVGTNPSVDGVAILRGEDVVDG